MISGGSIDPSRYRRSVVGFISNLSSVWEQIDNCVPADECDELRELVRDDLDFCEFIIKS